MNIACVLKSAFNAFNDNGGTIFNIYQCFADHFTWNAIRGVVKFMFLGCLSVKFADKVGVAWSLSAGLGVVADLFTWNAINGAIRASNFRQNGRGMVLVWGFGCFLTKEWWLGMSGTPDPPFATPLKAISIICLCINSLVLEFSIFERFDFTLIRDQRNAWWNINYFRNF